MTTPATATWSVAKAKAKLSEVIARAASKGPQTVTRHGRKVAVIVSPGEWERRTRRKGTIVEFFARSPLRGSGIDLTRTKDGPRPVDL
jgi:prevent-host-death family protein